MTGRCPTCNQPLSDTNAQRRDPPLPRLEKLDVVTIHDLPEEERAKAQIVCERGVQKLIK